MLFPGFRAIIQRVQSLIDEPYGEIEDNLLSQNFLPINLLRGKLAMFGAAKFDPKSRLWMRIALFQGAPLACELEEHSMNDAGTLCSLNG